MVEAQHKDQAAADIGYSTVVWDRRIDDVMAKDARARARYRCVSALEKWCSTVCSFTQGRSPKVRNIVLV